MDESFNDLEDLLRARPHPLASAAFRVRVLTAMGDAAPAPAPRRWSWVEWSLAAAALLLIWGGLLMMSASTDHFRRRPAMTHEEAAALDRGLRELLPELDAHERRRLRLLQQAS